MKNNEFKTSKKRMNSFIELVINKFKIKYK